MDTSCTGKVSDARLLLWLLTLYSPEFVEDSDGTNLGLVFTKLIPHIMNFKSLIVFSLPFLVDIVVLVDNDGFRAHLGGRRIRRMGVFLGCTTCIACVDSGNRTYRKRDLKGLRTWYMQGQHFDEENGKRKENFRWIRRLDNKELQGYRSQVMRESKGIRTERAIQSNMTAICKRRREIDEKRLCLVVTSLG